MAQTFHVGKRVGLVAEFCAICRSVSVFDLFEAFVTRDSKAAKVHAIRCTSCEYTLLTDSRNYLSVVEGPHHPLATVIEKTNPNVTQKWASRLQFEKQLKDGRLDPALRAEDMRECFHLLAATIENPPGGERVGCWVAAGIGSSIAIIVLGETIGGDHRLAISYVGFLLLAISLLPIPVLVLFSPLWKKLWRRRYLTRKGYPLLARSLGPFNPSLEELTGGLSDLRTLGTNAARYINPEVLHRAIESRRDFGVDL